MFLTKKLYVLKGITTAANLFLSSRKLNTAKCIYSALQSKPSQEKKTNIDDHWTRIYYYRQIRHATILNRLKLYMTIYTVASVPLSIALYSDGAIELSVVKFATGCALFSCGTLFILTAFFRRLIGIISISEDEKTVKISHMTFWGRRKDIIVSIKDIIPLTDSEYSSNDAFIKIKRFSSPEILYLTLRYGSILDQIKFEQIFKSADVFGFKK